MATQICKEGIISYPRAEISLGLCSGRNGAPRDQFKLRKGEEKRLRDADNKREKC